MQRRRQAEGGYTIIEVMIFLAVSMFMFIAAAAFINGKQDNTQFSQAMNDINIQVQKVINNVSDNNYPSTSLYCSVTGAGGSFTITGTNGTQGTNLGCDYLGQVLQFGVNNGTNGRDYNLYTVAGCQYSDCGENSPLSILSDNPPSNFSDAKPQTIDPGSDDCTTGSIGSIQTDLTNCDQLEWGLMATDMYDDSSGTPVKTNSIGFFNSFAQEQSSGQGLVSGNQSVLVVDPGTGSNVDISAGSTDNKDESGMVTMINTYLNNYTGSTGIPSPYFVVCFTDGHGNIGALTIGGGNSSGASYQHLTTSIQMGDSPILPFGSIYSSDKCVA